MGTSPTTPLILLTNDDGIDAPGLAALAAALNGLGETWVVAPENEQSGISHALTLKGTIRTAPLGKKRIAVQGTPADCVMIAVQRLLPHRPALVVSGINSGANLGEDIHYSGTAAAAMEAALLGLPALALSLDRGEPAQWETAGWYGRRLAAEILSRELPAGVFLNVNIPNFPRQEILGVRVTRQGRLAYRDTLEPVNENGATAFRIGASNPIGLEAADSDTAAVAARCVSVTPLHPDMTHWETVRKFQTAGSKLQTGV